MTRYQFNALPKWEQAQAVAEHGVVISDLINKHYKLVLYQLEDFYVEIWHDFKVKTVVKYRSFEETEQLAPYLNQVSLDGLNEILI